MPSDLQVFVRFQERCIFAGEELNCIITFKNVAAAPDSIPTVSHARSIGQSARNVSHGQGHKPRRSISTSIPNRSRHRPNFSLASPPLSVDTSVSSTPTRPEFKHQRSVSIVSLNSPPISAPIGSVQNEKRPSPYHGHRRSSTIQVAGDAARRVTGPIRQASSDFRIPGRKSPLSASETPSASEFSTPTFKFPAPKTSDASLNQQSATNLSVNQRPIHRSVASTGYLSNHRDSIDIYNHSNHSGETLMSEQASVLSERPQLSTVNQTLQRTSSVVTRKSRPVTMLMGYAQVNASFTLDASLVDQTPFEEVKKKGFLGGQAGGGVVGVKKKTRGSGFFGALGFGSLTESLENMMNNDNLSSSKEMKAVTSARAIPLLSTPQSLLFVDLRLEPGEERSFSFTYQIPRGLPSSYRGKAIKISYNLVIGIQGQPAAKEAQSIRQVNVPIRVFPGVDRDGEIYGHDLMQPYVVLQDAARTKLLAPSDENSLTFKKANETRAVSSKEFLKYVNTLLEKKRRRQSSVGTIDTAMGGGDASNSATAQAINHAILLSNQIAASSESSPNRFEIARSGTKIATIVLDRPLHRLGETITAVVDFSESQLTCTSLRATLETAERVEDVLAVRAASAISRISRKIYGSRSENVLFSKRAVFCPTIPTHATPTFVTSGVSLDWYIRLEFGTIRSGSHGQDDSSNPELLEEIMKDERGTVNVAVEHVDCDTFEVSIPITVYGDVVSDGRDTEDVTGIPI